MPKATITKTSADSAVVDPFVLREGATTRLVFKPQIVNNTADANKPVKGELLWQRRKRSEQDADSVLMLYRESAYNEDAPDQGSTDVYVRKNRNGPTGRVGLHFNHARMSVVSIQ